MGAWIEIKEEYIEIEIQEKVAPHDGCVDWNLCVSWNDKEPKSSHPTMGAWIEIYWYS